MKLFINLLGLASLAITAVLAAPTAQDSSVAALSGGLYYLRTNAPTMPWHNRNLVLLPKTHNVGLENFTVSPETQPLLFTPHKLEGDNYQLISSLPSGNPDGPRYLTAVSNPATRVVYMRLMDNLSQCPKGLHCYLDTWAMDGDGADGFKNFRFANYKGVWEPLKDAAPEGWHVYWRGEIGSGQSQVKFDLVPLHR